MVQPPEERARRRIRWAGLAIAGLTLAGALCVVLVRHGFSARARPLAAEEFLARRLRWLATPAGVRNLRNPVTATPENLRDGRIHFADHCASCHGNDGSGETAVGRNLYPKAPDMRKVETQKLTDGELFYIIKNGIRFTGMPAWGTGTAQDDESSWKLVHFIRQLPKQTPDEIDEMRRYNPRSPAEADEKTVEERFLSGADATVPQTAEPSSQSVRPKGHQ
jgi:mono/diheme cytochrome c family protein